MEIILTPEQCDEVVAKSLMTSFEVLLDEGESGELLESFMNVIEYYTAPSDFIEWKKSVFVKQLKGSE